jgi:hypothetical protein
MGPVYTTQRPGKGTARRRSGRSQVNPAVYERKTCNANFQLTNLTLSPKLCKDIKFGRCAAGNAHGV